MIQTGIYSGSFNPIHIGHLALANYLCEFTDLDEIWFVVTPHNPMKSETDLLDDTLRLEMVKKVIKDYPKFKASDFEFTLPKPTYTISTLEALRVAYPERTFHLIIGADNWKIFSQWKASETIIRDFGIFIYPRKNYTVDTENLPGNVRFVNAPIFDISATMIRKAIKEGKDMRYFLPQGIYEFWKESYVL